MWVRMRLDIGWSDLLAGFAFCFMPDQRLRVVRETSRSWNQLENVLITLSVRSAFDLTLRSLQFSRGTEILLSALTVPDMVRIVRMHGLIPVPVDTDAAGNISLKSLKQSISKKTRLIVVAHLFGGYSNLEDVLEIAKQQKLIVIEDCAQSLRSVGDSGHPESDIAMFSFGPIKTATALGGSVVRVSSPELRRRMLEILERDQIQSRISFARRILRFMALKMLSGEKGSALFRFCIQCLGRDFDSLTNSVARGFDSSDSLAQFRQRPSSALLRLLRRRWRSYDFARIDRRIQHGRHLDASLGLKHDVSHSYWIYPVFVHDPIAVRDRFRASGFDATCQSRMAVVPAIDELRTAPSASNCWRQVVFLPWYPEMPNQAVHRMAELVSHSEIMEDQGWMCSGLKKAQ